MFNLEQSIADWRRQMLTAGIKAPVPLEELEIHLREDVEREVRMGSDAQEAFRISVRRIGQPETLMSEFKKAGAPMELQKFMDLAGVICVAVAIFCPLFVFLPFLLAHELGLMTKMLGLTVHATTVATIVLGWRYSHKLLPVIHNRLLRRAVGVVCYAGCLLWIRFGIFHFSPGGLPPRNIFLPLFIFGLEWTLVAALGGVGHGLEKAAGRQNAMTGR